LSLFCEKLYLNFPIIKALVSQGSKSYGMKLQELIFILTKLIYANFIRNVLREVQISQRKVL